MTAESLETRAMRLLESALDQPSADRAAWVRTKCDGDEALAARVMSLLRADIESEHFLRTGGASADAAVPELPERIGAYKITGLIGQGGMGAVYAGERDAEDFEHLVAIKVIRPEALTDDLIARFQRERQILAQLNHSNIARLYGGGETVQGAPYIVMERIEGEPITDWATRYQLGRGARLALFTQLCRAVRHAHQNLIIHRDITPANVLVTESGTVKLIDFGIAKPDLGASEEDIDAGDSASTGLSYTPGYAAPERTHGGPANTLSDVFSLGKILKALTGEHANDADLDAIIACASAVDPAHRYASVDALLDDVTAYQDGYPVDARKGGVGYRFGRYLKRRKYGVAAAVGLLGLLIAGLITTTVLYQRAEAERMAADTRFNDVRHLARFMMFDLYDELEKVPGNTRTISMLADESLTYLESLKSDARGSLDVSLDAINGFRRMADILGNPDIANLGFRAEAGDMLNEALIELEYLHARHPDNTDVMRALGETAFSNSTHVYITTDNSQLALDHAHRSVEMFTRLATAPGAIFDDKRQLLRARLMTAVPLPWIDRGDEGIEILRSLREDTRQLAMEYPGELAARQFEGSVCVELARAIVRDAQTPEGQESALEFWDDAIRIRHENYADDPSDLRSYRSLVTLYYERGAVHRGAGRYDQALEDTQRTIDIAEELLALDPDDAWLQRIHGGAFEERSRTLSYAGRHAEAVAQARAILPLERASYEARPDDRGTLREWAYALTLFAEVFLNAGEVSEGCALVGEARGHWDALHAAAPLTPLDLNRSVALVEELEVQCRS